ncbi:MAG: nitroreductase family protein [Desulfovibrio sp.]|jgi:hypothetical protein|nr:nitroreductase family protein [Desulfovibrio sp.]
MKPYTLALSLSLVLVTAGAAVFASGSFAAESPEKRIVLPKPVISGGPPLMDAMSRRKTTRNVSEKQISQQDLSNLLWSAWGINRPDGKRTVPTARNRQEAIVYVALKEGVWRYDAVGNALVQIAETDAASRFGAAPLTLLYAGRADDDAGGMHVGSMYQNVGLYCAAVGLGNVVKSSGRDALDTALNLPSGYKIYIVHSIGWPK